MPLIPTKSFGFGFFTVLYGIPKMIVAGDVGVDRIIVGICDDNTLPFVTEGIVVDIRNGDEISSPTMHHSFRPPLSDLKS